MIYKTALMNVALDALDALYNTSGMTKLASGKNKTTIAIEPNTEKAKIVEAEIKKHPNALFFRSKAIEANIPNSNGDYFSEEELLKSYKTFEGVPFFTNHDNQNIENARGKIIYAEWVPEEKAVYTISFVDRDAYPHICRSIEEEYVRGVSMGCSVEYSTCNICGNKAEKTDDYCTHIKNRKGRKFTGRARNVVTGEVRDFKDQPVFEYNFGLKFIELSAVVDPACPTCFIQGIIPNVDYLNKVANIENTLRMIRTSAIEKHASKEEVEKIEGVLQTLEDFAVSLVKKRKQVEPSFAGELVEIMTSLQEWLDELVGAGYGNLQDEVPGTVGDDTTKTPEGAQQGAPSEAPAETPQLPPSTGTGVVGAVPAAAETAMPQASQTVGKVTGAPGKPSVAMPKLPITAPMKPRASNSQTIQRIADERIEKGNEIIKKAANLCEKMNKLGDTDMGKRRTITEKQEQIDKARELLSSSWKEKQDFFEYIKEVPSLQDNDCKLSVKKRDDSFIIVAESKSPSDDSDDSEKTMTWTYEDLTDEDKQLIKESPKQAAVKMMETFAKGLTKQKEGVNRMTDINKKAGATTVLGVPDQVQEAQLDQKGLYHGRTNQESNQITQAQLESLRKGEQEVITQKQLDDAKLKLNPRTGTEADQVQEAQLDGLREKDDKHQITQAQLDANRVNNEQEVVTEAQLKSIPAPWARSAKSSAIYKSAKEHLNSAIEVMAKGVISAGCTPDEVCEVAASLVDTVKNRCDLATSILETEKSGEEIDYAKRAAFWNNKNLKVASTSKKEIAQLIVDGLRKVASDQTINPEVLINAVDVIGEGGDAIPAIAKKVDEKLQESAKTAKASINLKSELREALKQNESTKEDRDAERAAILASVANEELKLKRESERQVWEHIINKEAAKNSDTVIETSFQEIGVAKNDPSFKKTIVGFTKGALASQNLKMAAITNVTISGDTIQIAVQTDEGDESVEIPVGENEIPAPEETMPEGDLTGEGLENTMGAAPAAPAETPAPAPAMASSKKMTKVAQSPMGGGVPGTPGGVSAPGAPEQGLPGGAPEGDAVQALTTDEGAAEDVPTVGEQQMPWTICPECGSSDVDVTNDNGDIKGKCNNAECGAEYEALVKKNIEFKIVKPSKLMGGEGTAETPEVPEETPEVPALPVAAQTRVDKGTIIRIGKNKEKHGHVCPACGKTACVAKKDESGHTEFTCPACKTDVEKDLLISASNPEVSYMRVSWDVKPSSKKTCKGCDEKVAKFASRIKVEKLLRSAADSKDKFPMTNCIERVARTYGGNTVGTFGPCKGKALADCVCKELQKLGMTKVRHMNKLAEVSTAKDPMDECMEDQQKKGHAVKEAESICTCLKNSMKKKLASEAFDNIYVQAFAEDIAEGKDKNLTTMDLINIHEIMREEQEMAVKTAKLAEKDEEIGDDLPALKEAEVEVEVIKEASPSSPVAKTETKVETKVAKTDAPVVKEAKGFFCDKCKKPTKSCECPKDGGDGDGKDKKEDKEDTKKESSNMNGKKILKVGEEVFKMASTPKKVEHIEVNVEAGVPRSDAKMGEESKADSLLNAPDKGPNVPRASAYMGKEKEADSLINKELKLPDVAVDSSYMGHEKEVQSGMPAINNEIKGTVIADSVELTIKDGRIEHIAKQMKEVDTVEKDVEAKVPRSDAKMGEESKADSHINAPNKGPDVPRSEAYMGEEKKADSLINESLKGPDVPIDSAYMGHEKEVQKGMPAINDEMLKQVRQQREDQMSKIASAREKKANQVTAWLVANKRLPDDMETFENTVKALSVFEIDKISSVADKMFPARTVKTASHEASKTVEAGHTIPAIVMESKPQVGESLAGKLSKAFTIGNSKFDENLTIYGERDSK